MDSIAEECHVCGDGELKRNTGTQFDIEEGRRIAAGRNRPCVFWPAIQQAHGKRLQLTAIHCAYRAIIMAEQALSAVDDADDVIILVSQVCGW